MTDRPNVVVFVTHDTGRHLGCYGIDEVHSPNIDRVAAEGVRFDRFFASSPMCSPSRAAMFSGLHPQTNGVMGLVHSPWWWEYNDDTKHISDYFRDAGYRTVAAGIVHEAHHVLETLGFEEHLLGTQASDVIKNAPPKLRELAAAGEPFYFQMGIFQTHSPYNADGVEPDSEKGVYVPPQYVRNETAENQFAELQGSIRHADHAVEEILNVLDETGRAENTIFVYTVDHGIAFPRSKGTLYDPGLGTALLLRWPAGGITGGRVCDHLLSNIDLTPTLLDLAGVALPDVHGKSFAEVCRDPNAPAINEAVFAEHTMPSPHPDTRCIRTDRWKLIRNFFPSRLIPIPVDLSQPGKTGIGPKVETPVAELYDLENDPLETNDLSADPEHADTLNELNRRLLEHLRAVNDPILETPTRWPYYERAVADLLSQEDA